LTVHNILYKNNSCILAGMPVQSYASRFVKWYRRVVNSTLNMKDINYHSFANSVSINLQRVLMHILPIGYLTSGPLS